MTRYFLLACGLTFAASAAALSTDHAPENNLTATQIVDKSVAARGGLDAWRAVDSLTLSGLMDAGSDKNTQLPFVMKMKRSHKSRLEISFDNQTAVQVYNGQQGWKLRPFLGRNEVEPFSPAEAKSAASWAELDGSLVDYAKKGTKVALLGTEAVEGHNAYKLKLTMKEGVERNVWIDASSFLELKIDGEPHKLDSKMRNVTIYYRDYRPENGLSVPHVLETVIEGGTKSHKMIIEQVKINQPMGDELFAKPMLQVAKANGQ